MGAPKLGTRPFQEVSRVIIDVSDDRMQTSASLPVHHIQREEQTFPLFRHADGEGSVCFGGMEPKACGYASRNSYQEPRVW